MRLWLLLMLYGYVTVVAAVLVGIAVAIVRALRRTRPAAMSRAWRSEDLQQRRDDARPE